MTGYLRWYTPLCSLGSRGIQGCLLRGERLPQKRGGRVKLHKVRLRLLLALGLLSTLALVIGHRSVMAVNGFSNNQELALPLTAPIANSGVSFTVRGLEPSVRVDAQGTVYVSSIRGVPGGVDLHRYYAAVDGAPGSGGTYAQTVYLNYHDVATFNIEVQRSNDGGRTYVDGFGEAIDPQTFPAVGGIPVTNSANTAGQIKVDRSSCASRGNLYQIFVAPDNVTENLAAGALRSIYVGVSTDVKLGLPAFTFTDTKVFSGPAGAQNQGANNLFPALATDDFGFVYAVWSDNSNIFYSFSTNQGTTWSNPMNVSFPVNGGNANVFPWIAADANGHVGIVWFGDDRTGNSNDRSILEPGHPATQGAACNSGTTCMQDWAQWNVYYAESVNGHDATPSFVQSVISDHVIHRGTISTGGLGGGADRSLADLFQVAFDPQHFANVAFSDDHLVNSLRLYNGSDI